MSDASPSRFHLSERWIGLIAAVVTVTIWTSFILIARASADPARGGTLTPFDIAYCRMIGAGLILLPWGVWRVRQDRLAGSSPGSWLGVFPLPMRIVVPLGFFGGVLYAMLAYSGFVYAPAVHASVLMPGSLPLWTALLAWWLLGDALGSARLIGLGLIVLGDVMVGGDSLLHALDGGQVWLGDLLFMVSAMAWACYSVLARHYRLDAVRATISITALACFTYVPVYTVLALTQQVPSQVFSAPWSEIFKQMAFQGWGSVVVSGISFTQMIRHFGPVRSTMITSLVPGLSACGAVLLLGEPLRWNLALGLLLVTGGIVFGVRASAAPALPVQAARA